MRHNTTLALCPACRALTAAEVVYVHRGCLLVESTWTCVCGKVVYHWHNSPNAPKWVPKPAKGQMVLFT